MPTPTVRPFPSFKPAEDGDSLRAAMKGFGTDEQTIIDILTARSNAQRQQIANYFQESLGRDLIKDLKSELGGKFEDVIVGLMLPPEQYLCKQLNKAMAGMGTDESALIEILCTKTNDEVKRLVGVYEDMYDRPLAEHLCSETGGYFRRLLTLIITGVRDESGSVDPSKAVQQAEALYAAGEAKLGTDEEVFNRIMAHSSFEHLRLVFQEYKKLSGQTIEQAVKHEMSGELKEAMMALIEYTQSPYAFFAKRLNAAMEGMGTNDTTLIRIIVSRSEVDLGDIKSEFERLFDRTLLSAVKSETSGDYKKALCALIGTA
ncbi:Annexin B10 [Pseudolycoriella hygida]|uniref:Annexin n=1 Tax=Pseudolycoriella hygida TaxID=35572 RepID=A0A9Q0N6W9_9DIPT|nr:Annexin B10 [Pseudolycoriella hygida]